MSWIDKFQEGCTGVSYFARLVGHRIEVEGCCEDHDKDYIVGGSWWKKVCSDARLAKCLYVGSRERIVGALRAGGAIIITTFVPYAYAVWRKR